MTLLEYAPVANLAERIVESIRPLCAQIEIAGSIRRRRPQVRDIDLVLIPRTLFGYPSDVLRTLRDTKDVEILRSGALITSLKVDTVPVQIYRSTPISWGMHLLRWTGSREHNIMMARRAKALGMSLRVSYGLVDGESGELIASMSEEAIFTALRMDYVPPEERETEYD